MTYLIQLIFGGLFSAIIIWIIKGFFTNLEKRVEKVEQTLDSRVESINLKIENLNNKYGEIFNELLKKFSNWEDRIKGIMDEVLRREIVQNGVNTTEYISNTMRDFDSGTAKDLENIKREINSISSDLEIFEKHSIEAYKGVKSDSQEFLVSTRKVLRKLNDDLSNLKFHMEKNVESFADKIKALHSVCTAINSDHKVLAEKFRVCARDNQHKISLIDKKR